MHPQDRDPPVYAPPDSPALPRHQAASPAEKVIDNPFLKAEWTQNDLVVALVFAQASSGRSGSAALDYAQRTAKEIGALPAFWHLERGPR